MEAAPLRPLQLPALGLLDVEKAKRDDEPYQPRNPSATTLPPCGASTEPPYSYTHTPHTTYSHAGLSTTATATAAAPELGTPPDSRRPSGEKDVGTQVAKQSLPSILEALGVDNQTTYQTPLSTQAPPILPLQAPAHKSMMPSSPVPAMRTYAQDPPQPHAEPFGPSYQHSSTPKYQPADTRSIFSSDARPALHLSTSSQPSYLSGPGSSSFSHTTSSSSPVYERGQGAAPGSFTYGYTPYPPRYQPSTSSNAGPVYQPSSITTAPSWKSEGSRHHERSYGESVKRHLDLYDLESGLNDITATSSFLGDFANRYGNLLHQSPRSGPQLSMLPGIIEIEDMISKSRAQTEALLKIRETVLAQQAAHDQEAAEQRQQKAYGDMAPPHSSGDSDDGKSTYSGSDAKKRRGRAAPPGRCHSCNRAETPEWRRGPDGARTLCNACGLHYAKLTRKQNNVGKPGAAINSSNLRPKEHMP